MLSPAMRLSNGIGGPTIHTKRPLMVEPSRPEIPR